MPLRVTIYPVVAAMLINAAFASTSSARTEKRKVTITPPSGAATCDHDVEHQEARVSRGHRDKLEWKIKNRCAVDQKVLLCVYLNGTLNNPFEPCASEPSGPDVGTAFTVRVRDTQELTCRARDNATVAHYQKQVLVGDEVPASGCPGHPLAATGDELARLRRTGGANATPTLIFTHILDIEVQP
jgi:hypothetical protein